MYCKKLSSASCQRLSKQLFVTVKRNSSVALEVYIFACMGVATESCQHCWVVAEVSAKVLIQV